MKKKLLALALTLCMALSLLPATALAAACPSEGGVSSRPAKAAAATSAAIEISSADELKKIGTDAYPLNGNYILTQDITLTDEWTPIGKGTRSGSSYTEGSTPFKGTFDGNGMTISGLKITTGNFGKDDAIGLFGVVDGGTVKNLNLKDVNINLTNNECAGGAIGLMVNNATANNISVSGTITVARGNGGIVGRMTISGTISNCVNKAKITGTSTGGNTAGIVGAAYYTANGQTMNITNCTNIGNITGYSGTGGIAGLCSANVSNCYNTGAISGQDASVGGIVGEQKGYGSIEGCTNTAAVTNTAAGYGTGGIVGWARYSVTDDGYPMTGVISVTNNTNSGSIISESKKDSNGNPLGSSAGGIVGHMYNAGIVTGNVNNAPSIKATSFAAGIVGSLQVADGNTYKDGGKITVIGNISTTLINDITASCTDLYAYNNDTKFIVKDNGVVWVAKIGDVNYATLEAAIAAAQNGETITLLRNVTDVPDTYILDGRHITIDFNNHTAKLANNGSLIVKHGTLNLTGTGKLTASNTSETLFCTIQINGSNTQQDSDYAVVEIGENVTVERTVNGYGVGVFAKDKDSTAGYGAKLIVAGKVIAPEGVSLNGTAKATDGNIPVIEIRPAAEIISDNIAFYGAGYGNYIINGGKITGSSGVEVRAGNLTISGNPVITATASQLDIHADGGGHTTDGAAVAIAQHTTKLPINVNISGGTFNGPAALNEANPQSNSDENLQKITLQVTGGNFEGNVNSIDKTGFISGGYFTSDPSAYVAEGKAALPSDKAEYTYMVGAQTSNNVKPATGEPDVTVPDTISKEEQDTVKTAAAGTGVTGLNAYANKEVSNVTQQQVTDANAQLQTAIQVGNNEIHIYAQTYLDVTPTAYSQDTNSKIYTVDITPMVRIVASTATTAEGIKLENTTGTSNTKNAVVLTNSEKKLDINHTVTVKIPLPDGFASTSTDLYVTHTKDNGQKFVYKCTVQGTKSDLYVEFANPNGFSEFTLKTAVAASITDGNNKTTYYDTLQEAVDAVQPNGTIKLEKDITKEEGATVSKDITFTIDNNNKNLADGALTPGYRTTMNTSTDIDSSKTTYTFDYTPPAPRYTIDVPTVENGTVTVDPTRAQRGQTITMTVKPDEGFTLDQVVVTDAQGKEIALTDNGDGTYTFKMPGSKVTVTPTFKAVEQPHVDHPFVDVDRNSWYNDAVQYVFDKGMMNGTSDTTFSPMAPTTRGMIITMLYRLEGQPAFTGTPTFKDVPAGEWFTDAVAWGTENGIIKGYSAEKFGPMDPITREQMAAILHRYAAFKSYDLSADADLNKFVDANQTGAWAVEDVRWANAHSLITGLEDNRLAPKNNAVRAQVATILMRFCETVAK